MTTALQAAKAFNKAHPPIVSLDRINQPGCPHHAICENCGHESGEHIRTFGQGYRCPTDAEIEQDRRNEDAIWDAAQNCR